MEDLTDPTLWWAAVVFQRARLRRISATDRHAALAGLLRDVEQ
jgi:hypothetical protein